MMPNWDKDFEAGRTLLTMNGLPVFEVSARTLPRRVIAVACASAYLALLACIMRFTPVRGNLVAQARHRLLTPCCLSEVANKLTESSPYA